MTVSADMASIYGGRTMLVNDKFGAVGGEVIRIDLTMWRRGDCNDTEPMGWIEIANIGPTSVDEGRDFGGERYYEYRMNGADGTTLSGTVVHCRRDGVLRLLSALFDPDAQVPEEFHDDNESAGAGSETIRKGH